MGSTATVKLIAKLQNNMSPGLRSLARGAAGLGTAIAGLATATFLATKKLSDYGAQIYDTAKATNVGIEEIQALGYVFSQTGGSVSSMGGALRGVNTFMRMAARDGAEQIEVLERLGLTYNDIKDLSPSDAFLLLTDRIGGMTNALEQNMTAAVLFGGRYSQQIIGALNQTDGSLRTLMTTFEESGRALSVDQIDTLKKYSDALTDLEYAGKKLMADALIPMIPMFKESGDELMVVAEDVLPKLVPLIENAIKIMKEGLPVVISLLGTVAEGWSELQTTIKDGFGGGELEDLQNSLTEAVKVGAITVEQATAMWEDHTRVINEGAEAGARMLNPISAAVLGMRDLSDTYGILGPQQVQINALFDAEAKAAFTAAAAIDTVNQVSQGISTGAQAQVAALASVAMAYNNIATAASGGDVEDDVDPFSTWADSLSGLTDDLGKVEKTLKELADVNRERTVEHQSQLEQIIALKQAAHEGDLAAEAALAEIEAAAFEAEQHRLDLIRTRFSEFFIGLGEAALQGTEGINRWWDNFEARLMKVILSTAFQQLLGVLAPGGFLGGIVKGVFGFTGGGVVPGASGGITVPGTGSSDNVIVMASPRERILTERQGADYDRTRQGKDGGHAGTVIHINWSPTFSAASPSEIARAGRDLKRIMDKAGL